jgi:diguanylate cyclase (GGDEF)-like protein
MDTPTLILYSVFGLVAIGTLLAISRVMITRQWYKQRQTQTRQAEEGRSPSEAQAKTTRRTGSLMSFFYTLTKQTKNIILVGTALILVTVTFLIPIRGVSRWIVWIILCAAIMVDMLLFLLYWNSVADRLERKVFHRARLEEEHTVQQAGGSTQHAVTALYTREFMMHMLDIYAGWQLGQPYPFRLLLVEINNLDLFRGQQGDVATGQVISSLGQALTRNVRAYDIVCHYDDKRLAVALLRCTDTTGRVEERITSRLKSTALDEANQRYQAQLSIRWGSATLPKDANTPAQLAQVAENNLVKT